jgi:hypothetical protein
MQIKVSSAAAAYLKEFPMGYEAKREREKRCSGPRFGGEPSLLEILADPVVQAMMSVDRVTACEVRRLMEETRDRREGN